MKTNKSIGIATIGLLTLSAMAGRADEVASTNAVVASSPSSNPPLTVGAEAGTTGAGVGANFRFSDHFGVGTAFDYFKYSYNGKIQDNNYNLHLRLMSEPLTLDLYPWKSSSFRVSAGLMFNQNRLTGATTGTLNLNGVPFPGATANLEIKQQPVDPYLALGGNLYFDKGHHFSLGGELGVVYTGDPKVNLTTTPPAPPSDVQAEQAKIKRYAKDAEFWPVLKVSLNYSF